MVIYLSFILHMFLSLIDAIKASLWNLDIDFGDDLHVFILHIT